MKQELKNAFGKVFISISVDQENKWVHTDWVGYLTRDNVKAGAQAYTELIRQTGLHCVLNDTSKVLGGWDHSLDWVVNEWAPKAAEAGIEHFALIAAPETFADSTASAFNSSLTSFQMKTFNNKLTAEHWLRQFSLGKAKE